MHRLAPVEVLLVATCVAGWSFAEENIAANEAAAMAACIAIAEAQEIYHRTDYDADAVLEYAQTLHGGKRMLVVAAADLAKVPKPSADEQKLIETNLKQLGDDDFNIREEAVKSLRSIGAVALGQLQAAAKGSDAEIATRAKQLIETIVEKHSPAEKAEGFGLYTNKEEGDLSLIDKALANAECPAGADPEKCVPKAGYLFRLLKGQTANAMGGKRSYIVNKNMILGYALIAFPKEYGKTGKDCFTMSFNGTVYRRDFGDKQKTDDYVKKATEFDPTNDWKPAE